MLLGCGAIDAQQKPVPAINSVAAKVFAAKVQPILSNACAECHTRKDYTGKMLLKPYDPDFNDPDLAASNLRAVVACIDRLDATKSSLLEFALRAHGQGKGKEAPLRDEKHPAYVTLELWVHTAVAAEGTPLLMNVPVKMQTTRPNVVQATTTEAKPVVATKEPGLLPLLQATPLTPDEFDPSRFNKPPHK